MPDDANMRGAAGSVSLHPPDGSGEPAPGTGSLPTVPLSDARPAIAFPGDGVPGYTILKLLASGGMGTVYLAEQHNPRRRVALKVVKGSAAGDEQLRRFEHEARVLARLQHPGIAQIHEAGTFDPGDGPRPFFAMEFVEGLSLTKFAALRGLTARERLELMVKVCEAVQHAHQKGVVHRDLKPDNILVTEGGLPKILDFGVARMTDSDTKAATMHTEAGRLWGTIRYMSPEQALGRVDEVDTRTDVYALGVLAYELVAGRLPYDLNRGAIIDAVKTIRDADPLPLSSVNRSLRGDVETILRKALEKEKARRYSSASDFGRDIQRYLNHEPVEARPASRSYQVRKFIQRNKTAALAAGLVLTGLFGTVWQAAGAVRQRQMKEEAIREARLALEETRRTRETSAGAVEKSEAELRAEREKASRNQLRLRQMEIKAERDRKTGGLAARAPAAAGAEVRSEDPETTAVLRLRASLAGFRRHMNAALAELEPGQEKVREELNAAGNILAGELGFQIGDFGRKAEGLALAMNSEIERRKAEAERAVALARLFGESNALAAARKYGEAIAKLKEILKSHPENAMAAARLESLERMGMEAAAGGSIPPSPERDLVLAKLRAKAVELEAAGDSGTLTAARVLWEQIGEIGGDADSGDVRARIRDLDARIRLSALEKR